MSESSSQTISMVFKSRENLLKQLKSQGYDTKNYDNFNVNEVHAMFVNKQLDFTLEGSDNKKTHVILLNITKTTVNICQNLAQTCLSRLARPPVCCCARSG